MAASAAGDSRPQIRKGLDSNYIRGYNCTRDTTYRSPRPSRLSPTAQRQAGGPLPQAHPTKENQLPQPPGCPQNKIQLPPPPLGGGPQGAGGARGAGPPEAPGGPLHPPPDLQIY